MTIFNLILLLIICVGILVILLILFAKEILKTLNEVSDIYRWFFRKNSGIFKVLFVLIFLFEQITFIIVLDMFFDITKRATTFIGIFALIVITTATFQAFIWEQKFKYSEEMSKSAESAKWVIDEQEEIINTLLEKLKSKKK